MKKEQSSYEMRKRIIEGCLREITHTSKVAVEVQQEGEKDVTDEVTQSVFTPCVAASNFS